MAEEKIMRDEAVSTSKETLLPIRSSSSPPHRSLTPAASSAGASSPAVPANAGSTDWYGQGHNSKEGSLFPIVSKPTYTSVSTSIVGSVVGSSQPSCRPWERGDLLRRLSTFKPENWVGKPKATSSLACARRGWVNVDVDTIECESCGAKLKFMSSASWTTSEADDAGKDFSKRLDEGHTITCPWTGNCCPESLVQFPPTPPSALIGGYKDRCDGLLQFPSLPIVAASAVELMKVSRGAEIDRFLVQAQFAGSESAVKLDILLGTEDLREDGIFVYSRSQKLISLCGWESRWLPNVQDCEEHSAQSARNGCSNGLSRYRGPLPDPGRGKKAMSSSRYKDFDMHEVNAAKSQSLCRSPLLDCSLCGATVRISEFLSVSRPSCFIPNSSDVPESSKKLTLTRERSAASGIFGWVTADVVDKEQVSDHGVPAVDEGKSPSNIEVNLNLTLSAGLSSSRLNMNVTSGQYQDVHRRRDLLIGQPSSSEVGNQAASYESHGPSSRKRNLEEGGSTVDRPPLWIQPTDSIEGNIIDREGDEVNDGRQYSAGPSKRARDSDIEPRRHGKDSYSAGPSQSFGFDIGADAYNDSRFDQGLDPVIGYPSTKDLTRASSVIAMNTIYNGEDNDSMESVENCPGDYDDIPSTSTLKNTDQYETSELNYSNQAQQSICEAAVRGSGEMGISSTNEDEVVNADTATAHGMDGPSFGISGGSVGMGASHEAEIHGAVASNYRADSSVDDGEPVAEITDNQGQTGEFAQDPGLMGDFVPRVIEQEDPHGDSQELMSRSVGRTDSGSKIVGSAKAESVESGGKTSNMRIALGENSPHLSLSCNAILDSGIETSKEQVTQAAKVLSTDDCGYGESGCMIANGIGPLNGESNYGEADEFDPIKHHNHFCPWVNGTVAAAGCSNSSSSSPSAGALAICGWQLTLDACDAFRSLDQLPAQTVESESAASMYKDDHLGPGRKLLARNSFNKSHGKN